MRQYDSHISPDILSMPNPILNFFKRPIFSDFRFIFSIIFIATLIISIQNTFFLGSNNYKIFYYSLYHLLEGVSLYQEYPLQYHDHYHYAPAFAVLFAPFFILPFNVGLFIWHFFFSAVWVIGIYKMPLSKNQKVFALWYGFQELLTALGNSQTNPLIAVIPLFAFICFENKKPFWAAFFILLGFNVKIYSIIAAALFVIYPQKVKFILSGIFWGIVMAVLPVFVTAPGKLIWQYELWINQLVIKTDHDKFYNVSIHRIIHQTFSPDIPTLAIVGAGVLLFCSVYIHVKAFKSITYRMLLLASILLFQIIFQPAAESATYITAVTGVIIWWLYSPKTTVDWVLVTGCYVLTVMSPTDFIPTYLKEHFIKPYVLKAWPCVLIWFRILYLMHKEGIYQKQLALKEEQHGED